MKQDDFGLNMCFRLSLAEACAESAEALPKPTTAPSQVPFDEAEGTAVTHLIHSPLIDRVQHDETVTIAKNNLPIADLVVHQPTGKRKIGLLKGKLKVPDDLMDEDENINALFYVDKS